MKSETDKSVRNQKVFITLAGYTSLVNEYKRVCGELDRLKNNPLGAAAQTQMMWRARKEALEFVFTTLGLPAVA